MSVQWVDLRFRIQAQDLREALERARDAALGAAAAIVSAQPATEHGDA